MSNFSDRFEIAFKVVGAAATAVTVVLAIVGGILILTHDEMVRNVHNAAACDETCAVMELRNMDQPDSCWCGDDDHSYHVMPFVWKNRDGVDQPSDDSDSLED